MPIGAAEKEAEPRARISEKDDHRPVVFKLQREKLDGSWGLELEITPSRGLVIANIPAEFNGAETPMWTYNQAAAKGKQVDHGDYLVKVNGKTDAAQMTRLLQDETELTLETRRPQAQTVAVPKNGRNLGFSLKYLESGASVFIGSVEPYGAAADAGADICVGDRIIAVNGRSGAGEIVEELRISDRPEITLTRLG